jgi:hypothetical protein
VSRCDPFRHLSRRQEALPASLKTPSPLCPALGSRADLHALPMRRFGAAPARSNTKAPPFAFLRDSMTRLYGSLPTLNGTISGYRSKARFRWVVNPFRAGLIPPGLNRNFQLLVSSTVSFRFMVFLTSAIPVSQGFGWRQERRRSGNGYRRRAFDCGLTVVAAEIISTRRG